MSDEQRTMIKSQDIGICRIERGKRGRKLPRGYQNVSGIEIIDQASRRSLGLAEFAEPGVPKKWLGRLELPDLRPQPAGCRYLWKTRAAVLWLKVQPGYSVDLRPVMDG